MTLGFALFVIGMAMVVSALQDKTVAQILAGSLGPDVPLGTGKRSDATQERYGYVLGGGNLKGQVGNVRSDVLEFGSNLSAVLGKPLTVTSGLRPGARTTTGQVSAHASGNAIDIGLRGKALVTAGQAALVLAGMSISDARESNGGLYNVGNWQIIFNTQEGGDHTDHLHIGRRG